MTRATAVVASCALVLGVAACSGGATSATTALTVPRNEASFLILYVSNQSFEEGSVGILVEIDDVIVVDDEFSAAGELLGTEFNIPLDSGVHTIEAVSSTGASYAGEIDMSDTTRWVVLDYSSVAGAGVRGFTFQIQDFPFEFR